MALGGAAITGNLGGDGAVIAGDPSPLPAAAQAADGPAADRGASPAPGGAQSVQAVVAESAPAVVKVTVGGRGDGGRLGSGFLVDRRGRVLTNAHVIDDAKTATVTFDDGTDFDWRDLPHPAHGLQRSLYNCLADFRGAAPRPREAHATAFVVVSRATREHIDRVGLANLGWWTDSWWAAAAASGHAAIASHSWDHNHEQAEHLMGRRRVTGTFRSIDGYELAEEEIARATAHLRRVVPNPGDRLFAYPYGESNDYLVRDYFPRNHVRIGVDEVLPFGRRHAGDVARPAPRTRRDSTPAHAPAPPARRQCTRVTR